MAGALSSLPRCRRRRRRRSVVELIGGRNGRGEEGVFYTCQQNPSGLGVSSIFRSLGPLVSNVRVCVGTPLNRPGPVRQRSYFCVIKIVQYHLKKYKYRLKKNFDEPTLRYLIIIIKNYIKIPCIRFRMASLGIVPMVIVFRTPTSRQTGLQSSWPVHSQGRILQLQQQ